MARSTSDWIEFSPRDGAWSSMTNYGKGFDLHLPVLKLWVWRISSADLWPINFVSRMQTPICVFKEGVYGFSMSFLTFSKSIETMTASLVFWYCDVGLMEKPRHSRANDMVSISELMTAMMTIWSCRWWRKFWEGWVGSVDSNPGDVMIVIDV